MITPPTKLPLPKLRGQTPPWVRIWTRLKNQWRKFMPEHGDGLTLRRVLGLREPRRLTPEELAELKHERALAKEARKRENQWRREARLFARKVSQTLESPCGIKHVTSEDKRGRKKVQRVRLMWRFSENGNIVYLKADTTPGKFPHGHNLDELHKPDVIRMVATNCGRIVEPWGNRAIPTGGGYRVYRNIGAEGFPMHVDYSDMYLKHRSASIARDNWAVPIGLSYNGKPWWKSYAEMGHILIAGAPGYGKSMRANSLICALIESNEPWRLEFIFVDFKGGLEFRFYKGLPHIRTVPRLFIKRRHKREDDDEDDMPETVEEAYAIKQQKADGPGLITEPYLMPGLLYWVNLEANRRFKIITDSGSEGKNLSEYNRWAHLHMRTPMPRLIVVIDEWSVVAYNRAINTVCTDLLTSTANIARAAGIQFVICTQHPNREVLPGAVIANCDTKIAYRIPDQYITRSLQMDDACRIDVKGRCLLNAPEAENILIQGPYISNETIRGIVDLAIKNGGNLPDETRRRGMAVSAEEIFAWALASNGGFLGSREVYEQFRTRGLSKNAAEKFCKAHEGDLVTVGETQYLVAPESDFPNRTPRRLLARGDPGAQTAGSLQTTGSFPPVVSTSHVPSPAPDGQDAT